MRGDGPETLTNKLFYGDNLEVLRGKDADGRPLIPDESVDLIYLDPPFNSAANYNVLFRAPDPTRPMITEAASHGMASYGLGKFRKIMVRTVGDLMRGIQDPHQTLPPLGRQEGFRRAARESAKKRGDQSALDL